MGLFDRVRTWFKPGEGAEREAPDERDADEAPVDRRTAIVAREKPGAAYAPLEKVGLPGGPSVDEAIALLRRARGTADEALAVQKTLENSADRNIPEPVRVACADVLAARGDEAAALRLLDGCTTTAGLVLASDLFAGSGQLPRAVGTIERVLARDLAAPGARERHARWTAALGYVRRPAPRDEATIVAPDRPAGPFRLLREVARGGAGTVYEAEDELLGRKIAFKVYHRRGADRVALEREARLASRLAGPGIVRVFDADPAAGWVALEWIPRGSIRDRLRAGDLEPLVPFGRWARPLARALARVHAAGYVHADLKPANVLLRQGGDAALGDFGIARAVDTRGEGGSPGYVSPERLAGRASHVRDDVYAYGRVLEDVLHQLESRAIVAPDAEPFRALALRCLGPDADRPADAAELVRLA